MYSLILPFINIFFFKLKKRKEHVNLISFVKYMIGKMKMKVGEIFLAYINSHSIPFHVDMLYVVCSM